MEVSLQVADLRVLLRASNLESFGIICILHFHCVCRWKLSVLFGGMWIIIKSFRHSDKVFSQDVLEPTAKCEIAVKMK